MQLVNVVNYMIDAFFISTHHMSRASLVSCIEKKFSLGEKQFQTWQNHDIVVNSISVHRKLSCVDKRSGELIHSRPF